MEEEWKGSNVLIDPTSIVNNANAIGFPVGYKMKEAPSPDAYDDIFMKGSNVLHRNIDRDRYRVRLDYRSADLAVICLFISIGIILEFAFGAEDVSGARLPREPAKQYIYFIPQKRNSRP